MKLMLSVGKLATMANGPAVTPQNKLSGGSKYCIVPVMRDNDILLAFNTALDFIAIHSSLLHQFTDQTRPMESTVDSHVKRLTAEKSAISSDRPALQAVSFQGAYTFNLDSQQKISNSRGFCDNFYRAKF